MLFYFVLPNLIFFSSFLGAHMRMSLQVATSLFRLVFINEFLKLMQIYSMHVF